MKIKFDIDIYGKIVQTEQLYGISVLSAIYNAKAWVADLVRPYANAKLTGP